VNVLVTGGAGLIGMALRQTLVASGHAVTAIDVTDFGRSDATLQRLGLEDESALDALVAANRIDSIAHCGAISGPMMAKGQPDLLVRVNIDATARLLNLARRHGMRRFVFCSSISVYGSVGPATIVERTPLHPTSVYGATKVASEALVEGFANEYGLDGVSLRIARVYGPYRRANCILGDAIRDAEAARPTTIACAPDFQYHYVYVDDVAEAIAAALEANALPSRAYNVGGGAAMTMSQIADIARTTLEGSQIALVPGEDDVPDVQTVFDIGMIQRDLSWRPRFGIADGLLAYRDAIRAGRAAGPV
jgi:UDP-glucuronate 4-epimerase